MRCRHTIAGIIGFLLAIICIVPIGDWMLGLWEAQYPKKEKQDMPDNIAGLIILGGSDARLVAAFDLYKNYPEKDIIFTGNQNEAIQAKEFITQRQLSFDDISIDDQSRNTFDNAVKAAKYVTDKEKPWILVTSASHMKRAEYTFTYQGWNIIPYAVDYRSRRNSPFLCLCPAQNFSKLNIVVHEIVGLIVYRFAGRI